VRRFLRRFTAVVITLATTVALVLTRKSPTLAGLATAPGFQVWQDIPPSRGTNIRAPEPHQFSGRSGTSQPANRNSGKCLDLDGGSAGFRADATFRPTAGLADADWTSYRSYNHPERHLRHTGFVLRIDSITSTSSTTDKQDATFRVDC
jgi:hypothetical protein